MKDFDKKIDSLMRFKRHLHHIFMRGFESEFDNVHQLTPKHFQTLMGLYYNGTSTMNEVSDRILLQKGSFTPIANKLEKIGFIKKERSEEDKRVYNLTITEEGKRFVVSFRDKHHLFVEERFKRLTDEERKEYFELIDKLDALNEKMNLESDKCCK